MTLLLRLLVSAVQLGGAALITSRVSWRMHPALIAWMLWQVFMEGVRWSGGNATLPPWTQIITPSILACVTAEVLAFSRISLTEAARGWWAASTIAVSALLSARPGMTDIQRIYLFRSYLLLAFAAALVVVAVYRLLHPIRDSRTRAKGWAVFHAECKRHKAYRIGAALWIAQLAICGAFVKGGLGYTLLPRTQAVWQAVNVISYCTITITVAVLSAAMTLASPGRKRAAKTPLGMTKTGLIEIDRAA